MKKLLLMMVLATCIAMISTTIPASAATMTIAGALSRISDGSYTAADLAYIKQFPDIAAQVPDPTDAGTAKVTYTPPETTNNSITYGTCGRTFDHQQAKRSLLGSTIYIYHQFWQYCSTSTRITKSQIRYDWLSSAQSHIYWRERIASSWGGIGTSTAWGFVQRHLEYCVAKYGCYANTYPWSRITIKAPNYVTYTGRNS